MSGTTPAEGGGTPAPGPGGESGSGAEVMRLRGIHLEAVLEAARRVLR